VDDALLARALSFVTAMGLVNDPEVLAFLFYSDTPHDQRTDAPRAICEMYQGTKRSSTCARTDWSQAQRFVRQGDARFHTGVNE
jgi:hypothetical protein